MSPERCQARRIRLCDMGLTLVPVIVTFGESRPRRVVTGDSRLTGRERFLRAGLVTPLPGGPGHRFGRHDDRSARCLAGLGQWTAGNARRSHVPGNTAW